MAARDNERVGVRDTRQQYVYLRNRPDLTIDNEEVFETPVASDRWVAEKAMPATELDEIITELQEGLANTPQLDENGKIPLANMPASVFTYKGAWNAATNTPELADGVGTCGDTYRVTNAGSVDFGAGAISFAVGDKAIYNGTVWEKWDVQDQEVPVGTYIQHAGASAPAGYLACNGSAVSRSTYAALFGVIATTYGVGDGSTTFNLPDARGLVMVGAGAHGTMTRANGAAYNGGVLGATRNDQLQGHWHDNKISGSGTAGRRAVTAAGTGNPDNTAVSGDYAVTSPVTDGVNGTPRTGDETRPAEIAVLVCIKF